MFVYQRLLYKTVKDSKRNTEFIIDASVVVKWLCRDREQFLEHSDAILYAFRKEKFELYSPELLLYEVGNALLKGKSLTLQDARVAFATLFYFEIHFVSIDSKLSQKSYEIAQKIGVTFYDAVYLALAAKFDVPLITANPKHHNNLNGVDVVPLDKWGV